MRFSVVIPVFNRPEMVKRAVESVLEQTYPPVQIIIVDDGSGDDTSQVLRDFHSSFPEVIKVITHETNRGVSAARNTGIRASATKWIALLDSDDEWKPEKLLKQHRFHQSHPDLLISQCDEVWIRNGQRVNKRDIHQKLNGQFFCEALKRCLVSPSATVFRRKLFDKIGPFDESLPACEDYDYWLRVLVHQPIGFLQEVEVIRYAGHHDQLSARYWGMDRWRVQAMEKHLDKPLPHDWKLALYSELISKLDVLFQGAQKRGKSSAEVFEKKIANYSTHLTNLKGTTETSDG